MLRQSKFAIIIPFAKSLSLLKEQVEALVPQLVGRPDGMLVLSCNTSELYSSLETSKFVASLVAQGLNVSLLDSSLRRGPSFARNNAWKQTKADYFLFCDDDDIVGANWVKALLEELISYDLVGGSLDYQTLNDERHSSWQPPRTTELPTKFSYLKFSPTCNLGVTLQALKTTGGFDEALICAQDIDFCWRAQQAGFQIGFSPEAVVNYRLRSSNKAIYTQAYRYGKGDAMLLKKHKSSGARVAASDTVRGLASVAITSLAAPFDRKVSGKAAHRWGLTLGHLVGSIQSRVWVL